jgi:DNA-binding transcriptional LysR family regulator
MLDATKLATLRAVIAHGSFSAAGEALALTQPAVSRQVSLLEAQLGTQLVRRTRQGVIATEAGHVLAGHADAILQRIAIAEEEVAALTGLRRGVVRLGSFFNALIYLSAELAALLTERHPGLLIEDHLVDRRAAFRGLAAGELDLAIVFEPAFAPEPAPQGIELTRLFDDPPRVLLPADHRLARRRRLTVADLAELNVVISDRVVVRPLVGGAPARHIQAAVMAGGGGPAARAALDALRDVTRARRGR